MASCVLLNRSTLLQGFWCLTALYQRVECMACAGTCQEHPDLLGESWCLGFLLFSMVYTRMWSQSSLPMRFQVASGDDPSLQHWWGSFCKQETRPRRTMPEAGSAGIACMRTPHLPACGNDRLCGQFLQNAVFGSLVPLIESRRCRTTDPEPGQSIDPLYSHQEIEASILNLDPGCPTFLWNRGQNPKKEGYPGCAWAT